MILFSKSGNSSACPLTLHQRLRLLRDVSFDVSHTACHKQSHIPILRNSVTETRCTHLNFDSCREYQNVKNCCGSVVRTVKAKSLVVSDHHINTLPLHVFLASHESRLTVSRPRRSWKCALGTPNFSELGGVQTTQKPVMHTKLHKGSSSQ